MIILTISFSIIEENHVFINVNICKKLTCNLTYSCCFLTDLDWGKKYALCHNNRTQHNIRKRNQSFE